MNNLTGVLRLTTAMFLFVGLFGIWMGGCENRIQEQQVERLIRQLQDRDPNVRGNAAITLGNIGVGTKDVVPVLIQALNDQSVSVRGNAAKVLDSIGTIYPEALEAVKEYRFRQ